jgi:hypothetical protein
MNLINIKNRRPLKIPSEDVVSVCKIAERIFRGYKNDIVKATCRETVVNIILRNVLTCSAFTSDIFIKHNFNESNHSYQLLSLLVDIFLNVRYFCEAKILSEKRKDIRQKYTKLILFSGL